MIRKFQLVMFMCFYSHNSPIWKGNVVSKPELEKRLGELNEFKDKDIAVICRSGRRSGTATDLLVKNGFYAVNVLGGMLQYRATETKKE